MAHTTGNWKLVDGMLARAPLAGGSPREVLPDVRWADWDADGDLAVVHYVDGHSRLEYPIGKMLYQSGGWISNIRFSPQGDKIAFMDHPGLWDNRGSVCVVDLAGHVRTLSNEWELGEWSRLATGRKGNLVHRHRKRQHPESDGSDSFGQSPHSVGLADRASPCRISPPTAVCWSR